MDVERELGIHMPLGSYEVFRPVPGLDSYTDLGEPCGTFSAGTHSPTRLMEMVASKAPMVVSQRLKKFTSAPDFFVCSRAFASRLPDVDAVRTLVKRYTRDVAKDVCYAVRGRLKVTIVDQGQNQVGIWLGAAAGMATMKVSAEEYIRLTDTGHSLLDRMLE